MFDVHKDGRNKYFTAYKMKLDTLPDGNKVVLANNWYVHYKPYLQANSLKQNTENFDNYVKIMISDIDEEIKTHPNLEFYIVNQGIYTSKTKVICSQVDLSESFLSKIMDQESCKVTQDFLGDKGQKINDAFDEYAALPHQMDH